jgi:hypothetical protein
VEAVAERILAVERDHPVRVAIDGCSAAGKSTFADRLAASLGQLTSRRVATLPTSRRRVVTVHRPPPCERQRRRSINPAILQIRNVPRGRLPFPSLPTGPGAPSETGPS